MAETVQRTKCLKCGFETPVGSGKWEKIALPSLGSVNKCPECGSTNLTILG